MKWHWKIFRKMSFSKLSCALLQKYWTEECTLCVKLWGIMLLGIEIFSFIALGGWIACQLIQKGVFTSSYFDDMIFNIHYSNNSIVANLNPRFYVKKLVNIL